ncbi:MAG: YidC/Oxa1 family membrane protein insertase [Acidimicrobiales bacterium]
MFDAIARVLAFFYSLPVVGGSYGLAIMLLTLAVMVVLMPLTVRATRSTIKMQLVQPKLKELQRKYKDDKATLNTELMELYKSEGINPVGGCLPMVAQLPVFLVLFRVLQGLSRRVSETPYFSIAQHARQSVGLSSVEGHTFDPKYLNPGSKMYQDLHGADSIPFGPFDLAKHPIDAIQDSFLRGIPYLLLIVFVVATSFYQQRQISARRQPGQPALMNPQQEMILKFLPLMSGIWSFAFPAGLVLYWATSNSFRILQQGYISRAFYTEDKVKAREEEAAAAKAAVEVEEAKGGKGKSGAKGDGSGGVKPPGRTQSGRSGAGRNGSDGSANGSSASANGSGTSDSDQSHGKMSSADRAQAWAQRRDSKARAQASRSRSEPSSRVTPKGTKPTDSKRKRKR